jgi:hypothetical protein
VRSVDGLRPIWVQTDSFGQPLAVQRRSWPKPRAVERVQDRWKIDDEWWRERPISRLYHALLLEDGVVVVAYYDFEAEAWFEAGVHLRRLEPRPEPGPEDPRPPASS